jgi:hypothetical protein
MRGQFDERALEIEIALLRDLELSELRAVWQKHYGSVAPKTVRRKILILSIAWRIQADALGDLKPATRKQLRQVAEAARAGTAVPVRAVSRTRIGTRLMRVWQGKTHTVTVLGDGFEWQGARYRSLSQIARLITGTRWNGPVFFGVKPRSPGPPVDARSKPARRRAVDA